MSSPRSWTAKRETELKREDYVFAIGFDGSSAIVDRYARSSYGKLDTRALADKGLFRSAYRSAVFDGDDEGAKYVLDRYNSVSPVSYKDAEDLAKVFGVQPPSDDITSVRVI